MTSPARAWHQKNETHFLEELRNRYEDDGFRFTIAPELGDLPSFMGGYRPDAIAQKPGLNIAIEIKSRQSPPASQQSLVALRRLFENRPDWRFDVAVMGSDPLHSITIPSGTPTAIRNHLREARALAADGHLGAAFVLSWSLLEAAWRTLRGGKAERPAGPGTVIQALTMDGNVAPETERRLRSLVELRNKVVHGDLSAEPTIADVDAVLNAVEEALSETVA